MGHIPVKCIYTNFNFPFSLSTLPLGTRGIIAHYVVDIRHYNNDDHHDTFLELYIIMSSRQAPQVYNIRCTHYLKPSKIYQNQKESKSESELKCIDSFFFIQVTRRKN